MVVEDLEVYWSCLGTRGNSWCMLVAPSSVLLSYRKYPWTRVPLIALVRVDFPAPLVARLNESQRNPHANPLHQVPSWARCTNPAFSKTVKVKKSQRCLAMSSAVWEWFATTVGSASFARSSLTKQSLVSKETLWSWSARWSGVNPEAFASEMLPPWRMIESAISTQSLSKQLGLGATCSALEPFLSHSFTDCGADCYKARNQVNISSLDSVGKSGEEQSFVIDL